MKGNGPRSQDPIKTVPLPYFWVAIHQLRNAVLIGQFGLIGLRTSWVLLSQRSRSVTPPCFLLVGQDRHAFYDEGLWWAQSELQRVHSQSSTGNRKKSPPVLRFRCSVCFIIVFQTCQTPLKLTSGGRQTSGRGGELCPGVTTKAPAAVTAALFRWTRG